MKTSYKLSYQRWPKIQGLPIKPGMPVIPAGIQPQGRETQTFDDRHTGRDAGIQPQGRETQTF